MEKVYNPQAIEKKWYSEWIKQGVFQPDPDKKERFSIVIPPPNVTGILHIGHVLNNTLQDILIRFKRQRGFQTVWIPGTDHAGIATQNKVEQALSKENLTKEDLGREAFLKRVWEWKEKHGGIIIQQLKKLGCSCDWTRERFTMDAGLSRAVREVFVRLFDKGLIYRGKYIVNQCPRCHTAVSDEEVEHKTVNGSLWYIRYPIPDSPDSIVVATTRPETMLGDVAVAVHPEDTRYRRFIGQSVVLPLCDRKIPIIADEMVDREFGTGAVKITPAHDANDFEAGNRHNLTPVIVIDDRGYMNENAPEAYRGLERFACRKQIVSDLDAAGFLVKTEKYVNSVGFCYRCNSVIEPYLSQQWFVRMAPLARPAKEAVTSGKITFYPDRWTKVYLHWMDNIRDWCISRQLWWGHRIPVWTCNACGHYQAFTAEPGTCPKCNSNDLTQDPDVLDTWFSSWLWPFSTLGWPDETPDLKNFYPTDTLITAPEIIFFWVARMIMAGLEFMDDIPFSKVYLHGTVRDGIGRKMSKSLGNSPDPLDIIQKHGADALRFSLIMISPRGSDIFFSEDSINAGKTLNNKIWNAARFVMQNCPERDESQDFPTDLTRFDKWMLYRLAVVNQQITGYLETFKFNEAAVAIHRFIWHEFCDWYLEISKLDLYSEDDPERKKSVQTILVKSMGYFLQMLHPFMPFITEEIRHNLYPSAPGISTAPWPDTEQFLAFKSEALEVEKIKNTIVSIRTMRSEMQIPPSMKIDAAIKISSEQDLKLHIDNAAVITFLCKLRSIDIGEFPAIPDCRATSVTSDGCDVYLDLEGVVDVPKELERLEKEIKKTKAEIGKVAKKLQNAQFMAKAPEAVVEKTKRISAELRDKESKLLHAKQMLEANI